MELRKEIEPDFIIAEKMYPQVLQLIVAYTEYCDENGDEDHTAYKKLEVTLHEITDKEMSRFNLWEWWEADGAENLAFDIALPAPAIVENITKNELSEIVRRLKTFELPKEGTFKDQFYSNLCFGNGYYHQFLKLNFKNYHLKLFQRNKDKNGNYFEYTHEEITEKLWNNGDY